MKYNRLLSILFVLLLTLSALRYGVVSSYPHTGRSHYKEPLTIDVFDSLANQQGIQSGWFAKIVQDKFNMKLNIIAPNTAGNGNTMYETRTAAGELGDLIICDASSHLQELVTAGLVLDMREYIDNKDIMRYETAIRTLNDPLSETAIYAIPSEISSKSYMEPSESNEPIYGPYMRYDLYTAAGSPDMSTLEDLLPVLKRMQELSPLSESGQPVYAFSLFADWDGNMMNAAKQPACFYGYEEYGFVLYKVDGSDYQNILTDDSIYQRILKFYFDANQLGLIDPESPNQKYMDVYQKCADGAVLFSHWPWLGKSAYNTVEHTAAGKGFMLVPINDLQVMLKGCHPIGDFSKVIAIGSGAEDPQRLADFIDWLYSPEGIYASCSQPVTGTAGPEGLTWEMTEKGPFITEYGSRALSNENPEVPEEWGGGTWNAGNSMLNFNGVSLNDTAPNGYPYFYTLWDSYRQYSVTPLDRLWRTDMQAETSLDYLLAHDQYVVCPGITYRTAPDSSEMATLRSQCSNVIVDYSWKMIFAKEETDFYALQKEMQNTALSLGYEQVLAQDMENARAQSILAQNDKSWYDINCE
ncbi:MAG: extracellular solute-binding protein [Ruminococcus sp.]|nr:extracellular solute-binding protein [Ruminococcus sp.]